MAQRFIRIRKASGLNRRKFAALLGYSPQRWLHYELGRCPPVETLRWLHLALGVNLNWLIAGTAPKAVPGRDLLKLEKKR